MSIASFVHGIDLSNNDFKNDFPEYIVNFVSLHWLKLNKTGLVDLPYCIKELSRLESIYVKWNGIRSLKNRLHDMPFLQSIVVRHNKLHSQSFSPGFFNKQDLSVLDLSYNEIDKIPDEISNPRSLIVLNLSHNNIKGLSASLFTSVVNLVYLDLSCNKIESIPAQLRRLVNLKTLLLNDNPLHHCPLRQLTSLTSLMHLNLKTTGRTPTNFPSGFESLCITELILSSNGLTELPSAVYGIKSLKRLDITDNQLLMLSSEIENWEQLEDLNVSRNKLKYLPPSLMTLTKLKRLFANSNQLSFDGIPVGIGKLKELQVFSACDNNLELVPEGLCRCSKLRKLYLASNNLITLPDAIHFLSLTHLDVSNNPGFIMPKRPVERQKGAGPLFYNVDFSLQKQLVLAGAEASESNVNHVDKKDKVARKKRLKQVNDIQNEAGAKVIEGMKEFHDSCIRRSEDRSILPEIRGKKWVEQLRKPILNYSDFFEEDVGRHPGIMCWEIDNFLPNRLDEAFYGKFYEGDCYIVLKTEYIKESNNFDWEIYFWIGKYATVDKQACAAMHSVNLLNMLGAKCRTVREEQGDESEQFLSLFDEIIYIEGARTESGFFNVREVNFPTKAYILSGNRELSITHVKPHFSALSASTVMLVDTGKVLYLWNGKFCNPVIKSKARLFAEKINRSERKNAAEIVQVNQGREPSQFWQLIDGPLPENYAIPEYVHLEKKPAILYQVGMGKGFLTLPQVDKELGLLKPEMLKQENVYILDCTTEMFIWIGKKSARLVRAAALKLAKELVNLFARPPNIPISQMLQGAESVVFKLAFFKWDDVIKSDYTRKSVPDEQICVKSKQKSEGFRTDLTALFLVRSPSMTFSEAEYVMQCFNEELVTQKLDAFHFDGKKFVKLPDDNYGIFYTKDSYIFFARYWISSDSNSEDNSNEDETSCAVYFWQGRESNNLGWFFFNFQLKKKLENSLSKSFEVIKLNQQQENIKFMSHFKRKFIIRKGSFFSDPSAQTEFFQIRWAHSPICTRCISIDVNSSLLCSEFCYILGVNSEKVAYVWNGNKSDKNDQSITKEIANYLFQSYEIQIIEECSEPSIFWELIGGKRQYDTSAEYMRCARLFKCSNDKGYFTISEKWADFCQDDLQDDDVMLLDTGEYVFIWVGPQACEIEIKMAFKSAQVYLQHLKIQEPTKPRKLKFCIKNREPLAFTKCFHGWSKHKIPPVRLERTILSDSVHTL